MALRDLVVQNRSYRRFYQDTSIDEDVLKQLVDLGRLSGSGKNFQPLKYILSCTDEKNELIFANLVWAIYLKDWAGPEKNDH